MTWADAESVSLEQIVEALNVEPIGWEEQDRFIHRPEYRKGEIPRHEKDRFWKGVVSWELRAQIEIWLSTGLNPDGSESPGNKIIPDELYVWSTVGVSRLVKSRSNDLRANESPRTWSQSLLDGAAFDARILLYALTENERKEYLCRCRFADCRRYFLQKRLQRNYKCGTFCCPKHQNRVSAVAGRRKGRAAAENTMVDYAAQILLTYPTNKGDWREDSKYKKQLAAMLSDYIYEKGLQSYWSGVKRNWITGHASQIEQKRQELARR